MSRDPDRFRSRLALDVLNWPHDPHGRITHLRMVCSGFRPTSPRAEADRTRTTA